MKKLKKLLVITLSLSLIMAMNVSLAFALDSEREAQLGNIDEIELAINAIKDSSKKEKLLDLNSIQYLELILEEQDSTSSDMSSVTDNIEKRISQSKEQGIREIQRLSMLEENQFDAEIRDKMQNLISMNKERADIVILPASYEILEKYGFHKEVSELKDMEQKAAIVSDNVIELQRAPYDSWEKSFTGYLTTSAGVVNATYVLTVQWKLDSNSKIYFWDIYHGGSYNRGHYEFRNYKVSQEQLWDESKVLCIESSAKYKKIRPIPLPTPPYDSIFIYAECTNTGVLAAWSWTENTYH